MSAQTLPTPPTNPPPPDYSSEPVPTYSATDDDSLFARIEQSTALNIPILHAPAQDWRAEFSRSFHDGQVLDPRHETYFLETDIVESFFTSVEAGRDDLVADFVSRGLVSPDVTRRNGETPLLAAVRVGKIFMVSRLVALGATVNAFGVSAIAANTGGDHSSYPKRTPLQLAAETGHLALVKVLMEDYGGDDSLVAPDGAIALRLAAINGHRDIVQYLPARRVGAWLRWKTAHEAEMKRVRRALGHIATFFKVIFWEIPKFFVYVIPKELGKSVWKGRHKVAAWCRRCKDTIVKLPGRTKRFAANLPGHVKNGAKWAWEGIKGIPPFLTKMIKDISRAVKEFAQGTWKVMKDIPPLLKEIAKETWKHIKAIPGVVKGFFLWIGRGLKSIGEAVFNVVARLVSLLHTAVSAVFSFFRSITLKDIWDGFCSLLRAIFIDTPHAIFRFIMSISDMTYDVLKGLFGFFGQLAWCIGAGILWLVIFVPRKLWQCLAAIGRSIQRAFQEVMAYLDPKRM
ncbi:hypothetical protein EDB80DRAFT_709450 [Ilyonectria destructans]|nr:hypothetical protein EDB80DRAFT_709450 [Ilyonectria destructans]